MTEAATPTTAVDAAQPDLNVLLEDVPDHIAEPLRAMWDYMRAENDALQEEVDALRDELSEYRAENERDKATIRQDVTENDGRLETIEDRQSEGSSDADSPGGNDPEPGSPDAETALEQICTLPEHMAEYELTANQERARFVAKDIEDYGQSVPVGVRIDSGDIRRVLSAAADDGETIYRTTVSRVIGFLNRFGGDETTVKKKHGRRFVIFDESLVDRLNRTNVCYGENGATPLRIG